MAYTPYGGYNFGYQPNMYNQPMQSQPTQDQFAQYRQNQQQGMILVQGESGAKSYLVSAGCTVPLWDSENQTVYIKSCDASGMPSMRIIDYTERVQAHGEAPAAAPKLEYVTRQEYDALVARVDALSKKEATQNAEPTV